MTGFVLLRVRAHRLLLSAAVLAVLLTTSVLAALTAFSGSVGDAALRHTLTHRSAASAALVVSASVDHEQRAEADEAVRKASLDAFDGLPVTVGKLESSGSYALPRSLQDPAARRGEPDLTHFAALDRGRVRITEGRAPAASDGTGPVQVALPVVAAEALKLKPGARLTVTDRLHDDKKQRVLVTGVYEAADRSDPYWQLDPLGGRGVRKLAFTTYGPLLTDPSVLASGALGGGQTSWLAAADFATLTTGSMAGLRDASAGAPKALAAAPVFKAGVTARMSLPTVLDQLDRALLVSRSTLMIVAVQLVLLAAYALLLVARLLNSERDGERELLRARGGSRGRITSFAAIEALLLAVPAAVVAPLLAGPLTGLLAERSALSRIGLEVGAASTGTVWLVSAAVALACALAVVAPSLTAGAGGRRTRAASLPGPVRAGADLGLLLIAGVAYWQLDRQAGGGALTGDQAGNLGIDPLLVTAPALALLAGTVLTLRLLPPAARLAERRAAKGRGLPAALAGWQFSRRPLRGAGPVLLLVLSVAMGMLAIGQSASWNRSQSDQADFGSGASVRLVGGHGSGPASAGIYSGLDGVRQAAPAHRTTVEASGGRTAEILALDTAHADEGMLMRSDLAGGSPRRVFDTIAPKRTPRPGLVLPKGSTRVLMDLRITTVSPKRSEAAPGTSPPVVTVLLEDRYGLPYRFLAGPVPVDGRPVPVSFAVSAAGGLAVTGIEVDDEAPYGRAEKRRVAVSDVRVVTGSGDDKASGSGSPEGSEGSEDFAGSEDSADQGRPERLVPVSGSVRWDASMALAQSGDSRPGKPPVGNGAAGLPDFTYDTGVSSEDTWEPTTSTLRITAARPKAAPLKAVATDAYLKSTNAKLGDEIDLTLAGNTVRVTLADAVRRLPTTGAAELSGAAGPAQYGGALLLDLKAVTELLAGRTTATIEATEWWLSAAPGDAPKVAAALRALPDTDPAQVLVRAEAAQQLVDDPLGAGPQSALPAVAVVAAALAAVGFAVSASGSRRERAAELGVLRALGAPRRQLARMIAAEQGVLIALALLIGLGIGTVLTRAVVPLIVLTGQADRPVPSVLVELPAGQVAALLAGVAALPLVIVATMALRRGDPAVTLRHQGDH
ncbi:FtsX-like permease family protein [Streptomyces sp. MBT67]|uniref:FtsX-like permease family protein n=1 Tax=unclassified Streptomyces TaxID=2593676 RepID=UPI00190B51C1|nr:MULTISPECIES: FtsX-like permease family protein [unclassified Streptomyces]MBK3530644.1 FtsX-like permease family protein [Streptomyces sp. MBT72]MBK3537256.1 FtsX-like permease family protein [Streptomyces sp. MBT67]MBK3553223.1 FtsX-like permease family protein [Streptomyces sp. MBT61]MBK6031680.1 FtsX-like permease family protein [Streptomyces sp. MBT59]